MSRSSLALDAVPVDVRPSWAVVRTKANQERVAMANLEMRDLELYCPRILLEPWHRRAPRGPLPLFPCYVFARRPFGLTAALMRYCPGVQYPLVVDGRLSLVDDVIVEALRELEGERGFIVPGEIDRGLEEGKRVKILAGPLVGLEGVLTGFVNGRDRARVLVEFLRRRTHLQIETTHLVLAR